MTVTTEPAYYDVAMTARHEPAMEPLESSPWRGLYEQAAAMIPGNVPVVDLGSGTGRFAEQLRRSGHGPYLGIDFSPAAIEECRRYVPLTDSDTGWDADFRVEDLRDWQPDPHRAGATVYVCLETLEHLDDDRELVRRVPAGHEFLFSVPSYESVSHLRFFRAAADAVARYGLLLDFKRWTLIELDARKVIHLFAAVRRVDTW